MMARVRCEVSDGLRPQEATVTVTDYDGRPEYMPLDRGMLLREGDDWYVGVHIVHIDTKHKAALVGLPIEADSGAHRIWVSLDRMSHIPMEALG